MGITILSYGAIANLIWLERSHTPWNLEPISNIASYQMRPANDEWTNRKPTAECNSCEECQGDVLNNSLNELGIDTWHGNTMKTVGSFHRIDTLLSELSALRSMDSGILASVDSLAISPTLFFILGYIADSLSIKRSGTGQPRSDTGSNGVLFEITFSIHFYVNE